MKTLAITTRCTHLRFVKIDPDTMAVVGPMRMPSMGSAAGLISMLEEEQVALQTAALRNLNSVVDTHWAEVAGSISVIEAMYEDEFFQQRDLAALLASKVRERRAPTLACMRSAQGGSERGRSVNTSVFFSQI